MPHFELVCLANSRKLGGRCVAGLRTDGRGWLRLVSAAEHGVLFTPDYTLGDGSEASVLDVLRVGAVKHRPALHQPENWLIDDGRWSLLARPMGYDLTAVLCSALVRGPELLGNSSDRTLHPLYEQQPAAASLALLAPDTLELYSKPNDWRGKPQVRGRFTLGEGRRACAYDLVVTDQFWEHAVLTHGTSCLRQTVSSFVLTISLSEPRELHCYKIIAAIVVLPPTLTRM